MTPLCGLCLDGAKPYPKGCPECGEKPRAKPVKLWLWRDSERFLAFDSLFPTMPGGGDPAVLGQPAGYAIFYPMTLAEAQAASREHKAEGVEAGPPSEASTNPLSRALKEKPHG